jgi:hypothetical protein
MFSDMRQKEAGQFLLAELDMAAVLDSDNGDVSYLLADAHISGVMREVCPECHAHLHLVLRQKGFKRAFIYCRNCIKCFDAISIDGVPVFS